ncbi:MAG TPA: DUF6441 family protein [Devosiaceae bacterium]|jgi:hypothetical protein|nr:DUF6441 family protein [Devosiaceae bacterium]
MRFVAALTGDLEKVMAEEAAAGKLAVTRGVMRTTGDLQKDLRGQVMATMGSVKVANAWRSATDPRLPTMSFGAAGRVWSNAPHIIDAFSAARAVRSPNGFFLAIPSPDAPREYMRRRVSPSNWNDERYGPLRFVYRRGAASLLVVDAVKRNKAGQVGRRLKDGGRTKSGGYRKGWSTVVMFFLVPFVRLPKLWDPQALYERVPAQMADNIIAAWGEQ